ncbi:hypothetical protein DND132_2452 [Pseudodesulfovibrio mercurii]|uniref:Lipocalin-like domain-containing protein n=1 Tax=Pseudodesulfovibrio mercurii TaxID=641491 RepID=F0JC82_9BACT|nr:hypothetical protein [Pseudodesulfovibrio mercurii]EGB15655.1 hypothetical protein DND132_2452 [Pseudodesulfovibrio mercurii]
MKKATFGLALLFVLCALPALAAGEVPDLKGSWVAKSVNVAGVKAGLYENPDAASTLVIEDQHGRVFTGYKKWTRKGETFTEKFAGGISSDNEIYIAEEKDGQLHGDYDAKAGALLLFYVESGPDAKVLEGVYVRTP